MTRLRRTVLAIVLVSAALSPNVAKAGCAGTSCGAICEDYGCIVVTDTWDTNACKPVAGAGCMSMNSLTCCPRIPRE